MSKRLCLITGTTHGIGLITARKLAARGYRVVMGCRNTQRAETVRATLVAETGNPDIHVIACDLADLSSVRHAAAQICDQYPQLDLLINNAGTMLSQFETTADGLELTFAANYLGPWLLTRLLLDRLVAADTARIVTVASAVHNQGRLDLETIGSETGQSFSGMAAYARSKLGNVMATLTQAELLQNTHVTANCLHPGVVGTNIAGDAGFFLKFGMKLAAPFMLSPQRGAATSLFLASHESLTSISGQYFDQHQKIVEPAAAARNREARQALWDWSSRACSVPPTWVPGP